MVRMRAFFSFFPLEKLVFANIRHSIYVIPLLIQEEERID